ncbi:ABC transporter ATP-binding protein [Chlamydiifrater phoenicopteri]|uniref:ABC transporter ATP-binding protein n=1 Tax=Chlamydiifrater phoenicopteri TaxID=2681469 RepID=UPI001BCAD8B4|nr:ATP-binding cassette domain-containing protein [Chlamydiifrater phoenicopteri]
MFRFTKIRDRKSDLEYPGIFNNRLIIVDRISKSYSDSQGSPKTVLDRVSLELYVGELLVVLGKSGTGKSVLLRHIVGLEKPDSGRVYYAPELRDDRGGLKKNSVGLVFQGGALFDFLSVRENIAFPLRFHKDSLPREKDEQEEVIRSKVSQALFEVGLEGIEDCMPSELSGGMRKRVSLARSMVYSPKVLLYDEPTSGLDPITSREISQLIVRLRKDKGVCGIVVTHDMSLARDIADRIAVHHEGRLESLSSFSSDAYSKHPLLSQFFQSNVYL